MNAYDRLLRREKSPYKDISTMLWYFVKHEEKNWKNFATHITLLNHRLEQILEQIDWLQSWLKTYVTEQVRIAARV